MFDVSFYENGNGGDIEKSQTDIVGTTGLFNIIYFALFGGMIEPENELTNQEGQTPRFDYWANDLLFSENESQQYRGNTERILAQTVTNSAGLSQLEDAANSDLEPFSEIFDLVSVTATVAGVDKINLAIKVQEPTGQSLFSFIWDGVRLESIEERTI